MTASDFWLALHLAEVFTAHGRLYRMHLQHRADAEVCADVHRAPIIRDNLAAKFGDAAHEAHGIFAREIAAIERQRAIEALRARGDSRE